MGHDCGTWGTLGPEPNKRDSLYVLRFEQEDHQEFKKLVHGAVDRPTRERDSVPSPQMHPLEMLPDADGKEGAHIVIQARKN